MLFPASKISWKKLQKKPGLLSSVVFKSKDLEMNIERLAFESEAYFLAPPQGEEWGPENFYGMQRSGHPRISLESSKSSKAGQFWRLHGSEAEDHLISMTLNRKYTW